MRTWAMRRTGGTPGGGRGMGPRTVLVAGFAAVSALFLVGVVLLASLSITGGGQTGPDAGDQAPTTTDWMPLPSTAPPIVVRTLLNSDFYVGAEDSPDFGPVLRECRSGEPVLVHALHPSAAEPDLWVVPLRDAAGHTRVLLTAPYDAAGQRVGQPSLGMVNRGDFNYARPMPPLALASAVRALAARGLSPATASGPHAPSLVYFVSVLVTGSVVWTGGGGENAPMWRVPASDGQTFYVGVDGRVYTAARLPPDAVG